MNTTSRPIGSWTFGLSGLCPLIQNALFRHASMEGELRRRKIVLEPGIISSGWIGTEATFPSTRCSNGSPRGKTSQTPSKSLRKRLDEVYVQEEESRVRNVAQVLAMLTEDDISSIEREKRG